MAIRVKKLAKALRARPEVILLALSDLGYTKYKSPMDMVADNAADKVRKLARSKGLPQLTAPSAPPAPPPRPPREPALQRPTGAPAQRPAPVPARPATTTEAGVDPLDIPIQALAHSGATAPTGPDLSQISAEIQTEERRLQARSRALAERDRALAASHAELEAERSRLQAERDSLALEKARLLDQVGALEAQMTERAAALDAIEAGGVPLSTLLEARGLRGADEQGRALAALGQARALDRLLPRLRVIDPEPFRRLLRERLLLGGVGAPELPGVAVVQVAEDRSELPSRERVTRLRADLAGEFLLAGLTRARLVGGGPTPHLLRMISGDLDPRVSLQVVPAARRDEDQVRDDVHDVDVVVLWGVEETDAARAAYAGQSVPVVRVSADGGLAGLLSGVREGLLDL